MSMSMSMLVIPHKSPKGIPTIKLMICKKSDLPSGQTLVCTWISCFFYIIQHILCPFVEESHEGRAKAYVVVFGSLDIHTSIALCLPVKQATSKTAIWYLLWQRFPFIGFILRPMLGVLLLSLRVAGFFFVWQAKRKQWQGWWRMDY